VCSLEEMADRAWAPLSRGSAQWGRARAQAAALQQLTLGEVREWLAACVARGGGERRRLGVLVDGEHSAGGHRPADGGAAEGSGQSDGDVGAETGRGARGDGAAVEQARSAEDQADPRVTQQGRHMWLARHGGPELAPRPVRPQAHVPDAQHASAHASQSATCPVMQITDVRAWQRSMPAVRTPCSAAKGGAADFAATRKTVPMARMASAAA
jgi:hypothetical protein